MSRFKKNSSPCGVIQVKDFIMKSKENTETSSHNHDFKVKPKEEPKCEILYCDNIVYSEKICMFHHILNNETKKCNSQICQSKRNGDSHRCKECNIIVNKLEDKFDELKNKMHKIVRDLNDNYARDYDSEIYFC